MELKCAVQQYDWGKTWPNSRVASLYKSANAEADINEKPYAELWMGTHKNGASKIKQSDEYLLDFIKKNPKQYLGDAYVDTFGADLSFILKVLSINKALSIQAHPDKILATKLHTNRPDLYADANHKPELVIALTNFEALIGFRPISEIQQFFNDIPELIELIGIDLCKQLMNVDVNKAEDALKACFTALMQCSQNVLDEQINKMLFRLKQLDSVTRINQLAELFERLNQQFVNDVGCFALYFLNVVHLKENQSCFLGPNEPHAYLSGDCVECMAASDNVVRAGLTPKFRDVATLCSMLDYASNSAQSKLFTPKHESACVDLYDPPVEDFQVVKIQLPASMESFQVPTRGFASILICIKGEGDFNQIKLLPGTAIFIPANETFEISNKLVGSDMLLFQAMANLI